MSTASMYTCNPREAKRFITKALSHHRVPFLRASPGVGKSAIHAEIADEFNLLMIDHRLSTSAPEDLSGLPKFDENGFAVFSPFAELFPLEDTPLPEGRDGWLIFLDEFNSATKEVQAAAYKLILDRRVGQHKLHPKVVVSCAGNLDTDRAIVNPISTAMQSRVSHVEMEVDFQCWLEDVAIPQEYDPRIIAYLNYNKGALMDFRPSHNEKTFCCPRTWEFMNDYIKGQSTEQVQKDLKLHAGTITSGVAALFNTFIGIIETLPTSQQVEKDPLNLNVPNKKEILWATVTHLATNVNDENLSALAAYVNRMELMFRVLFFRMVIQKNPGMRSNPDMQAAVIALSAYLNN